MSKFKMSKFKVGDKVRLDDKIKDFKYGQGHVGYDELGKIERIYGDDNIVVNFPSQDWCGLEKELILVSRDNKTFFKKLPNDYTGTLEIENGYVVEKEILNEAEKEYLSAVIRPFKDRVVSITKVSLVDGYYFISIALENETIDLPNFEKDTMYKGMELDKEYTLEELDLK